MTSSSQHPKTSKNKKTTFIIAIILAATVGLYVTPYFLFAVLQKPDFILEKEAKSDLYSYAAKLPQGWEKSKDYYFDGSNAETILNKIKYSQTGYSWKVIGADKLEWERLLTARRTTVPLLGGEKAVELHSCVRYSTSLKTKALNVLPIPCSKEKVRYGEVLLDKSELDKRIKQN